MIPAVLIAKKRDGRELSESEIISLVDGFTRGEVADYQMSAWAMAVCCRGMTARETAALTQAMRDSGQCMPRHAEQAPRVDKHSTGGLGDKVSLILAPLLACCDVVVPMISGRGLGLTGGTLDKLESIAGFQCEYNIEQADQLLNHCGCHIVSASERLAPADRKLYALRDVTGTVESVALITASILSKKLAASLDALVMDVKVGDGAFMKSLEDAQQLAQQILSTAATMNLPVTALITDMDQPLGRAVGNAVEVHEAIQVLSGSGPPQVRELTVRLCIPPLIAVGRAKDPDEAMALLNRKLDDGSARERWEQMIAAQNGRLDQPMTIAPKHPLICPHDGFVSRIDCQQIGQAIVDLGGGRKKATDAIDHSVGMLVDVSVGQAVDRGQELGWVLCSDDQAQQWQRRLTDAFEISDQPQSKRPLVLDCQTWSTDSQ